MSNKIFFKEGPFFEVQERLDDFCNSIFASCALTQTMEEFAKLKVEYSIAVSSSMDEAELKAKRIELQYYESVIDLTAHSMVASQEEASRD